MVEPLEFLFQGDSSDAERAFDRLRDEERKTDKQTKSLRETFRDLTVIFAGLVGGARLLGRGLASIGGQAARQEQAEARLAVALTKRADATEETVRADLERLKAFASSRQAITNFGDELVLELATIGASFELTAGQIESAVIASVDQAEALGRSPLELMRMVSRFGAGLSDSLIEVGIAADTSKPRVEAFDDAMRQMATGMSEAIGALPTSAFTQLSNTFGDLIEKLGSVVSSTATFQTVVGLLGRAMSALDSALSDPAAFKEVVDFIDSLVESIVKGFVFAINLALSVLSAFLRGVQETVVALNRLTVETNAYETAAVGALENAASSIDEVNAKLAEFALQESIFSDAARTASDVVGSFVSTLFEMRDAASEAGEEQIKLGVTLEEFKLRVAEIVTGFGEGFAGAFGNLFQDLFDDEVSISNSFRNLGRSVREEFIGQFTDAAFSPVKAVFGQLAIALRQPFEVVGNVINAILSPITNLITTVISTLVTQFFTLIGLQELLVGTGIAGVGAVAAGAAPLAAVWGAAATAAAIATLGGAVAFAAPAQTAIVTGASLSKALSLPSLAEGGIALPVPGGQIVRVAEAGQPEAIVPLPRGGGAAPGIGGLTINIDLNGAIIRDEGVAQVLAEELAREIDVSRGETSDFLFGGVV